jgi:hypothetical protein
MLTRHTEGAPCTPHKQAKVVMEAALQMRL